MSNLRSQLQHVFTKNRAEEIGYDVWEHFVIPPFYNRLDLQTARKPRVVVGGRGCGKTMLLRYLSHQSMFSPYRKSIPPDALSNIGLYWRSDTQFSNVMAKRNVPDDTWQAAFNHYAALVLGLEILGSLNSIARSSFPSLGLADIDEIDFGRLNAFDQHLPHSASGLYAKLEENLWTFVQWVNDVRKSKEPTFLPGRDFILAIIHLIKESQLVTFFRNSVFLVYVDEYENLLECQQEIINTWLKHSEDPLIFNVAMKRNAFTSRGTVGTEALSDIHDMRQHDLEAYLLEDKTGVFAAEILFLQLSFTDLSASPIEVEDLRTTETLSNRSEKLYTDKVLKAVQGLLPDTSHKDLAIQVFEDSALSAKLQAIGAGRDKPHESLAQLCIIVAHGHTVWLREPGPGSQCSNTGYDLFLESAFRSYRQLYQLTRYHRPFRDH